MTVIKLPQLGETLVEGTILRWLKKEGDTVALDEPLFELSTDKVDTEVPSSAAGVLVKILVPEGTTVAVGADVAEISEPGGAVAAPAAPAVVAPVATETAPASAAIPVPATPAAPKPAAPPAATTSIPAPPVPPAAASAPPAARADAPRSSVLSPLVRRLATDNAVDLGLVTGTGQGGRITKRDVLGHIATRGATVAAPAAVEAPPASTANVAPPPASSAPGVQERIAVTHIRRAIATHMRDSLATTARAWTLVEVDVEDLVRLRERTKETFRQRYGVNLTYLSFVTRAVCDALVAFPMVNARLDGDEIVLHRYVDMGIAVSYDEGLIVPVIRGADGMNTVGLARAIADLAERARAHALKPDEVRGSTFTITNPGPYGSTMSVPIINTPNAAILSLDAIVRRPVVVGEAIAIRSMVNVSMSWDHRIVDGELATRFLGRVRDNLQTWDFAEDLRL